MHEAIRGKGFVRDHIIALKVCEFAAGFANDKGHGADIPAGHPRFDHGLDLTHGDEGMAIGVAPSPGCHGEVDKLKEGLHPPALDHGSVPAAGEDAAFDR